MLASKLLSACGGSETLYVDDVFSTWLYTGNGSTQTITNGIDLAGKGGMVWSKSRASAQSHFLIDSATGRSWGLSDATIAFTPPSGAPPGVISSFNSNGYTLGINSGVNLSGEANVSWTFRKAAKFFDCGTYTGNGVAGRQIPHSLGVAPGMVVVKQSNGVRDWAVWHRSLADATYLKLNTTEAAITNNTFNVFGDGASQTSTHFTVGKTGSSGVNGLTNANASGEEYVWYAFAHDTAADGIIQCGSLTVSAGRNDVVDLGFEAQFVITKTSNTADPWRMWDSMRGMSMTAQNQLLANTSGAEVSTGSWIEPNPRGFQLGGGGYAAGNQVVYLAIRRPNKPPTTGTQVYNAIARTGTNISTNTTGVGFSPDLVAIKSRSLGYGAPVFHDRLRGAAVKLDSSSTTSEVATSPFVSIDQNGYTISSDAQGSWNQASATYIDWSLRRAPGVFDIVCYTGTGSASNISHSLGVAPELIITKRRDAATNWIARTEAIRAAGNFLFLNSTGGVASNGTQGYGTPAAPTTTTFGVDSTLGIANPYVALLFATLPGISKVFSFTGNGSSQTINCGFTTGARFILIKRTDSTGDWYVWDSTRGIVAGNDPRLSLNSTAAEVTTDDSIDPDATGFIVNQLAATNINVNAASYIGLAFA